jgi:hypothetical protein
MTSRSLMALRSDMCRFPVADIIDWEYAAKRQLLYCAAPALKGRPYCPAHMAVAYRRQSPRQSREDRLLATEALAAAMAGSLEKV